MDQKTTFPQPILPEAWGKWTLTGCLDDKGNCRLYQAFREQSGKKEYSSVHIQRMNEGALPGDCEVAMDAIMRSCELDSPDILQVFDCSAIEEGSWPSGLPVYYLYSRSESVHPYAEWYKKHPDDIRETVRVGIALCSALEICHSAGLYHGHLSMESVFITDDGQIRLGGFGAPAVTQGVNVAPEYWGETTGSSQRDVYSLGILLYRLLNGGRPPFSPAYPAPISREEREAAQERLLSGEAKPIPAACDEELAAIILRACAYSPMERYPDAASLKADLTAYQNTLPVGIPLVDDSDYPDREEEEDSPIPLWLRSPRTWIAAGLGVLLLLLIILCALHLPKLFDTPDDPPDETEPGITVAPESDSPETTVPITEVPETEPPVTQPPETEAPVTLPPVTEAPETEPEIIEVIAVTVSDGELTLNVGDSAELKAVISPANAQDKTVIWTTSDPKVAKVDEKGKITAMGPGQADITASSANEKSDICRITVKENAILAESITLKDESYTLQPGQHIQLHATILPSDTTDLTITWGSGNPEVATVDENGVVTAHTEGSAKIFAKTVNGKMDDCTILVKKSAPEGGGEGENLIAVDQSSLTMAVGNSYQIRTASLIPGTTFTWSSSNDEVVVVDDGLVIALAGGSAVITVSAPNHRPTKIQVTVLPDEIYPESVSLNVYHLELKAMTSYQLYGSVLPSNVTNASLLWHSSDSNVAIVDASGRVTALAVGMAVITATSSNGLTATCTVNVSP